MQRQFGSLMAILWLAGCSYSTVRVEHLKPDGTKLAVKYFSSRDLDATLSTNGEFHITARATEPTDATTRQLKTVFEGLQNLGVSAAKQMAVP